MYRVLFAFIAIGTVIGLAVPTSKRPPAAPASVPQNDGQARETVLERESNGHFYVHAKVNGELVRFLVDTGASGVALTVEDAQRIGIPVNPAEFEYIGEGASGPIRGKPIMLHEVDVDGKKVTDVRGAILEGSELSLLGQSYLSRMGEVQMRGDYMVLR
jgi:aspartyl protease family protein